MRINLVPPGVDNVVHALVSDTVKTESGTAYVDICATGGSNEEALENLVEVLSALCVRLNVVAEEAEERAFDLSRVEIEK